MSSRGPTSGVSTPIVFEAILRRLFSEPLLVDLNSLFDVVIFRSVPLRNLSSSHESTIELNPI